MVKKIIRELSGYSRFIKHFVIHKRNEMADYRHPKVNLGRIQATLNRDRAGQLRMPDVEFRVFSQFGDDGIIQYLVDKMSVADRTFIEFGVEDYKESNTRFLLVNNFWAGYVIDGNKENIDSLKSEQLYSFFDIKADSAFINAENVNEILAASGFGKNVGLLSIDIDGNDYYVWNTLETHASIVICEYNSLFGFEDPVTIPYMPGFVRGGERPFNYYGASLAALSSLASSKGYFFIGCNSAGNNAYFISNQLKDVCPFPEVSLEEGYVFASFTEMRGAGGDMLKGLDPMKNLNGLPLIDVLTGNQVNFDADRISRSLKKAGKIRREF